LRDSAAAEDIVQESFLRLALESQVRRYPRQPRAWLYRVVRNLIISGARRAAVARRQSAQDPFADVVLESPEIHVPASERRRILAIAMEAGGPDGRTGLILAAQGYSGREIAEVLGRSEAATRTLMCRARGSVRRQLTSQEATHVAG
jgi:RNA polymerase sigma-70 factor (ECF subfamily)